MNDAWNIAGWTAQNQAWPPNTPTPPVPLPPNFKAVTITAKYVNDKGFSLDDSVLRFTPSAQRVADGDTAVWLKRIDARIESGLLTVTLLATDVAGVTPAFSWHVQECFPGGQEWDFLVPSATISPVSLFSLPLATSS